MNRGFSTTRIGFAAGVVLVLCGGVIALFGLYGQITGRLCEEAGRAAPACPGDMNSL